MGRKSILFMLIALLMCSAALAQTYTVRQDDSGVYSSPFRAFGVLLTGNSQINWLEVGPGTACSGQSEPAVGFIFLTVPDKGLNNICVPLINAPGPSSGAFQSDDGSVKGTYTLNITTKQACSGGRGGGGCHTVFTIHHDDPSAVPPVVSNITFN